MALLQHRLQRLPPQLQLLRQPPPRRRPRLPRGGRRRGGLHRNPRRAATGRGRGRWLVSLRFATPPNPNGDERRGEGKG
uniref:Uncharacterized protein n=1 Tax=Arundo donax TaxID=35708 RepID=A0A0A9G8W2_ARUDO